MKSMGIDYGSRKTGIALSDDEGTIAFPHKVLPTDKRLSGSIADLVITEGVGQIVIGESIGYSNKENPIMKGIRQLKKELEAKTGIPVLFESEMFTSAEAKRFQGERDGIDASAAALILQHFIDRNKTDSA
ncbi:MAG: pre-16S rRNA-processing nuclease YqgF [Parcubacteria group bacterium]|nr:pre-16S rRNA-processing nuclease YqgF [Parcubacteria group bacterium]